MLSLRSHFASCWFFFADAEKKAADITDTEYVEKQVAAVMAQEGYEVRNIRVINPMLAQKKVDTEGRLVQLFTVQGSYDAYFQYRRKESQEEWTDGEKHFLVTFDRGKWSCREIERN